MGKFTPNPYRVFRNGEWVWIHPEPQEYKPDPLKSIDIKANALFRRVLKTKKRKK